MQSKHIVLIVFDYMGYGDIEPFGRSEIRTPNIRGLAEGGLRLTDFYAAAPICVPSRAAMLTGRYPRHLGIERNINRGEPGLPVTEKTLARHFADAGFRTALYGKWHLGFTPADSPNAHGFEDFFGFHVWNIDYYSHRTRDGRDGLWRNGEMVRCEGYTTDLFTEAAVEFIDIHAAEPFFLYVAYNAGLPPYTPPGREANLDGRDTWVDGDRADYAAMVESLDRGVGRIVDALRRNGLEREALVMLTYDHGGAELATKAGFFHGFGTLWEGGIRVPLILHWPVAMAAGRVETAPGIGVDVAPTLLAAAGLAADRPLDGVDLLGAASAAERTLHWRIDLPTVRDDWRARAQRAVRRGRWKYLWDGGFEFLHDLALDPGERDNLAWREPALLAELRRLSQSDW